MSYRTAAATRVETRVDAAAYRGRWARGLKKGTTVGCLPRRTPCPPRSCACPARACMCPGQQHPREHVTSVTSAVPALTSLLTSIRPPAPRITATRVLGPSPRLIGSSNTRARAPRIRTYIIHIRRVRCFSVVSGTYILYNNVIGRTKRFPFPSRTVSYFFLISTGVFFSLSLPIFVSARVHPSVRNVSAHPASDSITECIPIYIYEQSNLCLTNSKGL